MTRTYSLVKPGMELEPRLHIRHGDPVATFEIMGVEDFDYPDLSPPQIDTTHQRSPGQVGEMINAPRPALVYDLSVQYWEGVSYEADLRALIASGEVVELLVTLGTSFRGWAARVLHYDPTSVPMNEKTMAMLRLTVMAEIDSPTALA